MSRGYLEDEGERVFYAHLQNSPTTSTFPKPPSDFFPRRRRLSLDQHLEPPPVRPTALDATSGTPLPFLARGMRRSKIAPPAPPPLDTRARSNSKSNGKGKESTPTMGSPSLTDQVPNFDRLYVQYRQNVPSVSSGDFHHHHHQHQHQSYSNARSTAAVGDSRPSTADGSTVNGGGAPTRRRGSLLLAASDALNIKFGRRRQAPPPPPPATLPNILDIRSSLHDTEEDERRRLRDEAAQAVGMGSYIVAQETPYADSATDEEEDENDSRNFYGGGRGRGRSNSNRSGGAWPTGLRNQDASALGGARGRLHGSSVSVTIPPHIQPPLASSALHKQQEQQQQQHSGRFRAGSVQSRGAKRMPPNVPIPAFPSTIAALAAFTQNAGEFPKYYPPSSLRIFALAKNWKSRYLVLTAPSNLVTQSRAPAVSYLHLFKTANPDEEEIERLEINEDSVVFVSEDEVGGRRQVIKVGGADVGAMKKEFIHGEGGHAMWLLHIPDQAVAHLWISSIKNAILGQRTVRAGLMPHSFGNNEPRGDMDVMLSIRAQGLVTSPTSPTNSTFRSNDISSPIPFQQPPADPNYASSISSQSARSQSTVPKTSPSSPVSVLKGFFSSGRPRSSSRATSINSDRQHDTTEGSFASMGNSLLGMLRSNTPDTQSINTVNTAPTMRTTAMSFPQSTTPIEQQLNRPIVPKPQSILWSASEPIHSTSPNMSEQNSPLGPTSLQPPPRKRWTSSTFTNQTTSRGQPAVSSPNTPTAESSRRISFSASVASKERQEPPQPLLSGFSFGSPQHTRAASLKSVSTYASADKVSNSGDKSSLNTKRSSGTRSARRWSRQSILPSRSNPPSEPPPAIPHPYATDQQSGHGSSQGSHKSFVSALPKFAKRQSGSSVQSFTSFSTTYSQSASATSHGAAHPRASPSSRNSMPPPPLPAPTTALPPAPASTDPTTPTQDSRGSSSIKSSYRNSIGGSRNFRNSMVAPKPPPSTNLPPRPDQPEYKEHHRRTLSAELAALSHTKLESIPASPVPPAKAVSPFSPPEASLSSPPQPPATSLPEATLSHPPVRTTSLIRRPRNLSAPTSSTTTNHVNNTNNNGTHDLGYPDNPSTSGDTLSSSFLSTSTPPTPLAERIAAFTHDDDDDLNHHPSFLHINTPVMPSLTLNPAEDPPPAEEEPIQFTELPPPPRRGSKQLLDTDVLTSFSASLRKVPDPRPPSPAHSVSRRFSISRPGSALSRRSEKTSPASESEWHDFNDEDSLQEDDVEPSPVESNARDAEHRPFSLSRPASIV